MLKLSTQITIPLDIPNVSVIEVTTDENGAWHIKVETDDKTTKCGICQQEIEIASVTINKRHSTKERLL